MKTIEKTFCKNLDKWQKANFIGTKTELGKMFKVSQGYISNILAGRNCGDETWRRFVAKKTGMDYDSMIGLKKIENSFLVQDQKGKSHIKDDAEKYRTIPIYESGRLAAWSNGAAFDMYEKPQRHIIIPVADLNGHAKHNLAAARVGGDSMEPVIPEGSTIVIDLSDKNYIANKVFAVAIKSAGVTNLAVKRVEKLDEAKGFLLLSENNAVYPPEFVKESDWLYLCVGRVISMCKKIC